LSGDMEKSASFSIWGAWSESIQISNCEPTRFVFL
jgi:hypothetical protein